MRISTCCYGSINFPIDASANVNVTISLRSAARPGVRVKVKIPILHSSVGNVLISVSKDFKRTHTCAYMCEQIAYGRYDESRLPGVEPLTYCLHDRFVERLITQLYVN